MREDGPGDTFRTDDAGVVATAQERDWTWVHEFD